MPSATPTQRTAADRCPGVLRLVDAADGGLARIRLPGGLLDATGLRALAGAARDLADGRIELTSRGNVQLRALRHEDSAELGARLAMAGLWPSSTHERVRNILASPLSDLSTQVHELDAALCADPRWAELSGRFLFGFDDGRGDIAALAPDVLATPGAVEGVLTGDVTASMLAFAGAFLDERQAQGSAAWRVDDLDGGRARILARLGLRRSVLPAPPPPPAPAGRIGDLHALLVPLGRLTAAQADWLADRIRDATAKVTPWRSVVVPHDCVDGADQAGFGVDAASRWYAVSACAGRPGCAQALADVQAEAARTADQWRGVTVHFSGCPRRCGRPVDTAVDVVATASGFQVEAVGASSA